jgi:HPr kinase/phosphorylase
MPDDLLEAAEESSTPLWTSPAAGVELASHLQHMLSRRVARHTSVHGVFMEVFSLGVLITGDSGSGKSELALELITRGHRLVADDAPDMTLIGPDVIDGTCPPLLQDCLEVRGLGILNVRAMFGDSAIKPNKYLRLIIHLQLMDASAIRNTDMDRLRGDQSEMEILGIGIPKITVPVAPGRNLAVLVEAAVRNHGLKMNGYDAAGEFLERHQQALEADS